MKKSTRYIGTSIIAFLIAVVKLIMMIGLGYMEGMSKARTSGYMAFEFITLEAFLLLILWGYSVKQES